jgi:hypothetical protein
VKLMDEGGRRLDRDVLSAMLEGGVFIGVLAGRKVDSPVSRFSREATILEVAVEVEDRRR